jgi:hypothetical protein
VGSILNRVALAFTLICASIPAHARTDADTKAVEAVFSDYVGGLAEGNLGKLSRAFAPEGVFVVVKAAKDGKPAMVASRPFKDELPSWAANPDPTTSGRIIGITVQNDMSSVQAELDFGADRFQDNLLLYKIDGRWQIVAKTTYASDRPNNAAQITDKE